MRRHTEAITDGGHSLGQHVNDYVQRDLGSNASTSSGSTAGVAADLNVVVLDFDVVGQRSSCGEGSGTEGEVEGDLGEGEHCSKDCEV